MNIPVLIPVFNPNESLIKLIDELIDHQVKHVIIINDGSNKETESIFNKLSEKKECYILTHDVNLGKGRALKTGMNFFCLKFASANGIVTADGDGQHTPQDIVRIAACLEKNPENLILGKRNFVGEIPLRSRLGNTITKHIFSFLVGKKVTDTQTGLRGIPRKFIPDFIQLSGERYEYEMNMLIATKQLSIPIVEVGIETIYIERNSASHFNPLIDSIRIYFLLLRFAFSSLAASLIDFALFSLLFFASSNILLSFIIARFFSAFFNFYFNLKVVFKKSGNICASLTRYSCLVFVVGSVSFYLIKDANEFWGINVIVAKIIVEIMLFLFSFVVQREFVFQNNKYTLEDYHHPVD